MKIKIESVGKTGLVKFNTSVLCCVSIVRTSVSTGGHETMQSGARLATFSMHVAIDARLFTDRGRPRCVQIALLLLPIVGARL